ncbi:MAG TPA: alpha/beta fold hydrolase [Archaeoglobaceae archaeon]|nr:alpha/beta fold hydrolase [Archaeoglobaceae archaeon]
MYFDKHIDRNFLRVHVEDVVIFCHGLPYQPGSVIEKNYDKLASYFAERGKPSVIFDFSGTGLSRGEFSLSAWRDDLVNIVEKFSKVDLIAFSLGGVPATFTSSLKNVRSLVLVATPCCFEHIRILDKIYTHAKSRGFIRGIRTYENFVSKIKQDMEDLEPLKWIKNSKSTMIVHGTADEIIPFESGKILYREADQPKYFLKVLNGGHSLRQEKAVIDEIISWLDKKKEK